MIAYALRSMSFLDRVRKLFAGPAHISDAGDDGAEVDAALAEEYGASDEGEADLKYMEETGGGGGTAGLRLGASEAAEASLDLETEEHPPDPDP
jgi:hypothetical protein